MKISDAVPMIERRIRLKIPSFLWGSPGIGKSACVHQIAAKLDMQLVDIRAVLLDPVDLRGLPTVSNGKAHWCPPAFLPSDPDSSGILFLDELANAPTLVQAACLQLTLDRCIGEYKLPPKWTIVAASNRQEDKSGAHRVIASLLNRFGGHIEISADIDDWLDWARDHEVHQDVRSFLAVKPSLLCTQPDGKTAAFASPRTWEFVSRCLKDGADVKDIATCIGPGAASELYAHIKLGSKVVPIDEILADPDTARIPDDLSVVCMVVESIIDYMVKSPKNLGKLWQYISRLKRENAMTAWIYVAKRKELLDAAIKVRAFQDWCGRAANTMKTLKEALK